MCPPANEPEEEPAHWREAQNHGHEDEDREPRRNRPGEERLQAPVRQDQAAAQAFVEQFAEDVLLISDLAGLQRFYVGGHSIGGMVALEVGRASPGRVKGIVSVEGWTDYRVQAAGLMLLTVWLVAAFW